MLKIEQYSEIKKGIRYIPFDVNTNSKIYANGSELTKFPTKQILLRGTLEPLLKYIDEKDIDCCIKVKSLIYKKNKFIGYKIKFYQDYKSLRKLLNRNFSLKKQDCINIEGVFNILTENNLQVFDHALSNILLNKEGKVLICDLDGLKINDSREVSKLNRKCLFVLALSYLYKIPANEIMVLVRNQSEFLIDNNKELIELFDKINNGEEVKINNLLDLISDDDVKIKRMSLKHDVECLKDSGYFRVFF